MNCGRVDWRPVDLGRNGPTPEGTCGCYAPLYLVPICAIAGGADATDMGIEKCSECPCDHGRLDGCKPSP